MSGTTQTLEAAFREVAGFKTELASFDKMLSSRFPEHKEAFKFLDDSINNWTINTNELASIYFKSKTNSSKSIKIVISPDIVRFTLNTDDCLLKKRIKESVNNGFRHKASYILDKNFNFLSVYEKSEKLLFYAINETEFKKIITDYKKTMLLSPYSNLMTKFSIKVGSKVSSSYRYRNNDTYNNIYGLESHEFSLLNNRDEFLDRLISISKKLDKNESSLGSLLNSIFDIHDRNTNLLNSYTKIVQEETVNPISGFVSIKNTRVVKDCCPNADTVLKAISEHRLTSNFFKSLGDAIKSAELKLSKANNFTVKLISGAEISALYNVSSYFKSSYNYNGGDHPIRDSNGGTLFNSCMRRPGNKFEIEFYSKADFVKMIVVSDEKNKVIKARAIVWYDKETDNHYVDRVYVINNEQYSLIANYIAERDNFFYIHSSLNGFLQDSKRKVGMIIPATPIETKTHTPYFDTVINSYFKKGDKYYVAARDIGGYTQVDKINQATDPNKLYLLPSSLSHGNKLIEMDSTENCKFKLKTVNCSRCGKKMFEHEAMDIRQSNGAEWMSICQNHLIKIEDGIFIKTSSDRIYEIDGDKESKKVYNRDDIFTGGKIISNAKKVLKDVNSSLIYYFSYVPGARASLTYPRVTQNQADLYPGIISNVSDNTYKVTKNSNYQYGYGIAYDESLYESVVFDNKNILIKKNMTEDEVIMYKAGLREVFAEKVGFGFKIQDIKKSSKIAAIALGIDQLPIEANLRRIISKDDSDCIFERGMTLGRNGVEIEYNGKKDYAVNSYFVCKINGKEEAVYIPVLVSSIYVNDKEKNDAIDKFVDEFVANEKSK